LKLNVLLKEMKIRFIIFLLFIPLVSLGQNRLSLSAAVDSALKNNFDIRIARNTLEINKIFNNYGEAGGLPNININGSDEQAMSDIHLKSQDGVVTDKTNTSNSTLNAGISASMTLFNGFRIVATKERLKLLQQQSELELNQQVQNTMAAVMVKYYDIVRQESYLNIIEASLDVSKQRLEVVRQRKNVGLANEADVLQAQIDVNMSEQNNISQQMVIDQAKTDLLQLMGVKKFIPIQIKDAILVDNSLILDTITAYLRHNPQYMSAEHQVKISEQLVKEISAQRYPSIKVSTACDFNLLGSDAGQYSVNRTIGPSAGVTVQIPVFNGFLISSHRKAALVNVKNAELEQQSLLNSLTAQAVKTYYSYSSTIEQLKTQRTNYEMSGQLVNLMLKRFQLSQATVLDMKAAQESYENAGNLLVNLQYAAKVAEIELKLLIYRLGN
jgi:outer membrane protein